LSSKISVLLRKEAQLVGMVVLVQHPIGVDFRGASVSHLMHPFGFSSTINSHSSILIPRFSCNNLL
jgi:hypothetical protein